MSQQWRIIDLITWAETYFKDKGFENPRNEIEWLIRSVLSISRIDVYLNFDRLLSLKELKKLKSFVNRRLKNEPLQYITESCEFYGREYFVNNNVLIPRPETETLIDLALENLKGLSSPKILDIGTGSGCLAITLAAEISDSRVTGIDISNEAINVANINKSKNKLKNISFKKIDILRQTIKDQFDLIISNPPYITKDELVTVIKDVKEYEPLIALTDGADGLTFYRRFFSIAKQSLKKNGSMLLEVGIDTHPKKVQDIFFKQGFINTRLFKDLNGDDRVIIINKL